MRNQLIRGAILAVAVALLGASSSDRSSRLPEEVIIGSAELTVGVPGNGPLSLDDLKVWLDNPKNHAVLQPMLPLGLAAGASQITGLDTNPLTRAKIELGRQLYFDTRLSKDNTVSCASCHAPEHGFAKETQFGVGVGGQLGGRNSPVAYNRILSGKQFWDGRADSLEEQAKGPIANPIEMSNTHELCIRTVNDIPCYRVQFERIFPDGVTIDNVAKAIASFERVLVTAPSPWDYYAQLRDFKKAYAAELQDLDLLKKDDPEAYKQYVEFQQAAVAHPLSETPSAAVSYSSARRRAAPPAMSEQTSATSSITTLASAWMPKSQTSVAMSSRRTTRIVVPSRRRQSAMSRSRRPTCMTARRKRWKPLSSITTRAASQIRTSTKNSSRSISLNRRKRT